MAENNEKKQHFILVHGACHGAWCWYKLKPLLEAAGHRVTVLDMAASGIDQRPLEEVRTLSEYSKPLLETMDGVIGGGEKVILVGHSLGGLSLALAMETHPDKVAAAVFLTAYVPDTVNSPSFVFDMHSEVNHIEDFLDMEFCSNGSTTQPFTSMLYGPKFLSSYLYHLSPIQDLELAKTLARPSPVLHESLSKAKNFSEEKFGKVTKVYVICKEDKILEKQFQEWMIQNSGIQNVMEIEGADHMPMFSKPQQLCQCLLHTAKKYV
ncbi:salicylic acid-binding protein 2-like [Benincasa hispida]|uniref:salicylic acid-binding protein 2-like n=1 Tax=Benincasa hispida TaxID=102211 RepID=UPI0019014A2E|nr:salicylic acid-binding protein 2-like [Benincasa hispida]